LTLAEVELQSAKYSAGLPEGLSAPVEPLPFTYETTYHETRFTNRADLEPRSQRVFAMHRPETLQAWVQRMVKAPAASTLRARLQRMPPLEPGGLWEVQATAIRNIEKSLSEDRPRALVQMATGSGKTYTAASLCYRLVRYAVARRILLLVDRSNLGRQTEREFQGFNIPETNRKFVQEYVIQRLQANHVDPAARVCISTIQVGIGVLFLSATTVGVAWARLPEGPVDRPGAMASPGGSEPTARVSPSPSPSPGVPCTQDLVVEALVRSDLRPGNPRPYALDPPTDPPAGVAFEFDIAQAYTPHTGFVLIYPTVYARQQAQVRFSSSEVDTMGRHIWSIHGLPQVDYAKYALAFYAVAGQGEPCATPQG
jgi:hypothetical protein